MLMPPIRLSTPKIFEPLWHSKKRFNGAWGGRGSGKSHDAGRRMLKQILDEPDEGAVCLREVQGSINESVHKLLADLIVDMNMGAYFQVLDNEIRRHNGRGDIIFRGMKAMNAENIKSLEGRKFAWFEEAQTADKHSLAILRPTLRRAGSQFMFTWNPRFKSDPVDVLMRQTLTDDEKCVVKANWYDNQYFSDEMELERQIDLRGDEDNYLWIWEGAYQAISDKQFIQFRDIRNAAKRAVYTDLSDVLIMGVDVARFGDDKSVICFRRGMDAASMKYESFEKVDTMHLSGRIAELAEEHSPDAIFIDETGIGGAVVDRLNQLGVYGVIGVGFGNASDRTTKGLPKCRNKRTEIWASMRLALAGGLSIPEHDDKLHAELSGPQFGYDEKDRLQLEKKIDMKKRGIPSPDIADALALTFAYPVTARRVLEAHNLKQAASKPYDPYANQ